MQNPEQELKKYRDQIYLDIIFLLNTRLKLLKEFSERKNDILWTMAVGGLSETFYRSLADNLVTTLSWIFSESKNDKRSLRWYLNQVKENVAGVKDEIDKQLEKLDSVNDIVDRIKTVRDKWVAHRDPIAFNNPNDFLEKINISFEDFESLIKLVEEITNEHFEWFDDTSVDFDLPINGIEIMAKGEKARLALIDFARDMFESKKSNSEEQKNNAIEKLLKKQSLL